MGISGLMSHKHAHSSNTYPCKVYKRVYSQVAVEDGVKQNAKLNFANCVI